MQLMKEGDEWELYIPSELGYGAQGAGADIPGGAALVFTMEIKKVHGKKFKRFYGMSSAVAMKKHAGGVAEYRSSEGKAVEVPYKGPVAATILDLYGGVRSACTYIGATTLKEMPKRTTFVRVSQQLNEVWGKS